MRILVTGGAGYIGSASLRWLLRAGHDPVAFDNLSMGNAEAVPDGRLIVGDIENRDGLVQALRECRAEAVMHFAAAASVPESIVKPEFYYRTNVIGTKNVLDAMRECGVGRIVFSSTAATYAFGGEMPIREDSPQVPEVPYGRSKLASEWLVKDYAQAYGFGYVILRYFNACGADSGGQHGEARENESHLIPLILAVPLGHRDKVLIYGNDYDTPDGTCIRDFVHIEDLASAHQRTLERLEPGQGRVYNVGTGHGVTVLETLRACEEVVGEPISHHVVGRRPGDPSTLVASVDKLRSELGWSPAYKGIRDIIETSWRWHQSHPDGYAPSVVTGPVD